ncbi:MAG: HEPN domain-containing protein [Chloroflexi bacterium]|nr:HEPN domain-containing protein [Chloroflexota bacterium]
MVLEGEGEAEALLAEADDDLAAAEAALQGQFSLPGDAAFRGQQAAAKALQAYLASRDTAFAGIQDLSVLLALCQQLDEEFGLLETAATTLQPYLARYLRPGRPLEPAQREAEIALELAAGVVEFVRVRL